MSGDSRTRVPFKPADRARNLITHMRWHRYRPPTWGYVDPDGVVDPCAGCGKAEEVHPYPTGKYDARVVHDLALALIRDRQRVPVTNKEKE